MGYFLLNECKNYSIKTSVTSNASVLNCKLHLKKKNSKSPKTLQPCILEPTHTHNPSSR